MIPVKLAEKLGLWPRLPKGTKTETYGVAGGGKVLTYRIADCLKTQVVTEDVVTDPIKNHGCDNGGGKGSGFQRQSDKRPSDGIRGSRGRDLEVQRREEIQKKREAGVLVALRVRDKLQTRGKAE